jgi:hypothetical protein
MPDDVSLARAVFHESVQRQRRHLRRIVVLFVVFLSTVALGIAFGKSPWNPVIGAAAFLSWVGFMVLLFTAPALRCGKCDMKLDSAVDRLCPECGNTSVVKTGWWAAPSCSSCGKVFTSRRGRGWAIRFCTYCGVHLDEIGA